MKKLIILFSLFTVVVFGVIPNKTTISREVFQSDTTRGYVSSKGHSYSCIEDILYVTIHRGGALSYNPKTKEPYYCIFNRTKKEVAFGEDKFLIKMKIFHTYEEMLPEKDINNFRRK